MRIFRIIGLLAGFISIIALSALSLFFVVLTFDLETGAALSGVLNALGGDNALRSLTGIAGLAAFLAIAFRLGRISNALTGAALVLSGVIAVAAFAPQIKVDQAAPTAQSNDLTSRLLAAREVAVDLETIDQALPVNQEIVGDNGGLAAAYFTLENTTRLRIEVMQPESQSDVDPVLFLKKVDQENREDTVARDDDGGDGLNSRLELELEPGRYLLDIRNVRQQPFGREPNFRLRIEKLSLEEIAKKTQQITLSRNVGDLQAEPPFFHKFERAILSDEAGQSQNYLVSVAPGDDTVCLVADVVIPSQTDANRAQMDTVLFLFDDGFNDLDRNDDVSSDNLGSRISWRVDAADSPKVFILTVQAWSRITEFDLQVELRAPNDDGVCYPQEYIRTQTALVRQDGSESDNGEEE